MEISVQLTQNAEWDIVKYNGDISEDTEMHLSQIVNSLRQNVIINFKHVENVNSCGVRVWVNFLRAIEVNRNIVFEECTPEIVSQINMIPNFKSSAEISSVYGAYLCDACGNTHWHLFEKSKNLPTTPEDEIEEVNCGKCGEAMEMEELEEEFFAWLEAS